MKNLKITWKQERLLEVDITKAVAGTGMSLREIGQKCGIHYTHLSKCLNGKSALSEQYFARLTSFLEDNQIV